MFMGRYNSQYKPAYGWFTRNQGGLEYFDWLKVVGVSVVGIMITAILAMVISPSILHLLKLFSITLFVGVAGTVLWN